MTTDITLGKEAHLIRRDYGKYDIEIQSNNFIMKESTEALDAAIRVKLLTAFNELSIIPHYTNWGNHTHEHIKENKNQLTLVKIREDTILALEEMRRVKNVNLVEVESNPDDVNMVIVTYNVTGLNDEDINGSILL